MIIQDWPSCPAGSGTQEGGWGQGCLSQQFLSILDHLSTCEDWRNREGEPKTSHLTSVLCQEWAVTVAFSAAMSVSVTSSLWHAWNLIPCLTKQLWGERICTEKGLQEVVEKWPAIVQNQLHHVQLLICGSLGLVWSHTEGGCSALWKEGQGLASLSLALYFVSYFAS